MEYIWGPGDLLSCQVIRKIHSILWIIVDYYEIILQFGWIVYVAVYASVVFLFGMHYIA